MHKRLGYFRRTRILKHANFLELTPMQQHNYRMESDGTATILIPKFTGWLASRILQPRVKHKYITLALDELGTATWLLCDGHQSVKTICKALKAKFGDKIRPAEQRITTFLSQLYKDNIIIFKEIVQ
jgi:hypothetical protein